jgi:cytochrome c-type biogenesis protein CcmI
MFIAAAILLLVLAFAAPLLVRAKDLPVAPPPSPTLHLDQRRAVIYENLRDLQNEYRMGKLSDEDYQATKKDLQQELATVMAQIEVAKKSAAPATEEPA